MAVHNIKGKELQINEITTLDELKVLAKKVFEYSEAFELAALDLVYAQWVMDRISESMGAITYVGNFPTFTDLETYTTTFGADGGQYATTGSGQTFTLYHYDDVALEWSTVGGSKLVTGTHAEIKALADGFNLKTGGKYLITDYSTIHTIPNSGGAIYTSPNIEQLVLTAISSSKFDIRVNSLLYPRHDLKYRVDLDSVEAGATYRPGLIISRYDPDTKTRVGEDYLEIRKRRFMILSKVYRLGVKVDDSNVTVTVPGNVPGLGNQSRYEVSFETMVHPSGPITLTLQYDNGTIVKPLLYHLNQTVGGSLPVDYLSNKKGTIIYNPILDAFVSMFYTDIGAECVGQYLALSGNDFSIGHGGISFIVDPLDFQDYTMFEGTYKEVNIPGNYDLLGGTSYYNNCIFKGNITGAIIGNSISNTTFNADISSLVCPGHITNNIILSASAGLDIEVEMYDSLILPAIGSFGTAYHRYSLVAGSTIKPTFSTQIKHRIEFSTILPASGASNTVIDGIVGNSNIFYAGIPISIGSNFYIQQGLFRCLIGYIDARGFTLNRSSNDETIYSRQTLSPTNILGYSEVDKLKIKALETPVGSIVVIGRDSEGNIVEATSEAGVVTLTEHSILIGGPGDIPIEFLVNTNGVIGRQAGNIINIPLVEKIVAPPAANNSIGIEGQEASDQYFLYKCVATNTWISIAKNTEPI